MVTHRRQLNDIAVPHAPVPKQLDKLWAQIEPVIAKKLVNISTLVKIDIYVGRQATVIKVRTTQKQQQEGDKGEGGWVMLTIPVCCGKNYSTLLITSFQSV